MFVRDPFDVAPGATRHTRVAWLTLAVGLVFMLACGALLERNLNAVRHAEDAGRTQRDLARASAEKEIAARQRSSDPAAVERMRAQQRLQNILRMSWSGLFDALESAGRQVDGGAVILALAPARTQADAAEVGLTGLAVSHQVVVDYIRALETSPGVRQVQLATQQPALSSGVQVVRFQLSFLWDPRVRPQPQPAVRPGSDAPREAKTR